MRKLVTAALLAATVAVVVAFPATAKTRSNGRVVFAVNDPVLKDDVVYTINPDGSHKRLLIKRAEGPRWSPDGKRIAVYPHDAADGIVQRIVNVNTRQYTDLPSPNPEVFLPCGVWSRPNGARLACEGFGPDSNPALGGIYTVRSKDGGGLKRVTSSDGGDDCPGSYSPDGRRLVLSRANHDGTGLYVVKTDGTGMRRITAPEVDVESCGSWSPEGNRILFASRPAGERNTLYVLRADGKGLRRLKLGDCGTATGCTSPAWSPDGSRIVFTRFFPDQRQSDIYVANANGTGMKAVTKTELSEGSPDWGTSPLVR
jgi:Tol biopolymer transport system component